MTILAIDTSNKVLCVGLVTNTGAIYEEVLVDTLQHSVKLIPTIEKVLSNSGTTMSDLTKIIVAKGPGSYTGLRIGVTVAKTLAKTLKIPLIAVSSFAPLIANVIVDLQYDDYICPFFDARRQNIFTGLYQQNQFSDIQLIKEEVHISWSEWLEKLAEIDGKIIFVGMLTPEQIHQIKSVLGNRAEFAPIVEAIPNVIGLVGYMDSLGSEVDPDTFVPTYLKLAEAEENWQAAHPHKEDTDYVERL